MTADRSHEWTPGSKSQATRRRFVIGGLGTAAAAGALSLIGRNPISALSGASTAAEIPNALVPYCKRSAWGAAEEYRFDSNGTELFPPDFHPIQKITIHHTGAWTPASASEAATLVRNVYYEHAINQGMGDIGYHLLIAPDGTVYEGRWSGGTHFPIYDIRPGTTSRPPMAVTGAHVRGYNVGNIGIAIMGDLDQADMSDEAWHSLQVVVAMIVANTGIDLRGTGTYNNPISGLSVDVPNVAMHRNFVETECPGNILFGYWSQLPSKVEARLADVSATTWLA
jgi:hypothetical protein